MASVQSGVAYYPYVIATGGPNPITVKITGSPNGFSAQSTPQMGGVGFLDSPIVTTGNASLSYTAVATEATQTQISATCALRVYNPDALDGNGHVILPNPPANLQAVNLGSGSYSFTFTPSLNSDNRPIYQYNVVLDGTQSSTEWGPGVDASGNPMPPPSTYSAGPYPGLSIGTHNVTAVTKDWAGQLSQTATLTFTISPPDHTPPTTPGTPSITFTQTSVNVFTANVSWGASTDNVAVASYSVNLYLGSAATGTPIATVTLNATQSGPPATSTSFPSLSAGTTYTVSVIATDTSNNPSGSSSKSGPTPAATIPGPLSVKGVGPYGFQLNWPSFSGATDYTLTVNSLITDVGSIQSVPTLTYQFGTLQPNTSYTVTLNATVPGQTVPPSNSIVVVTSGLALNAIPPPTRPSFSGNLVARLAGSLSVDTHGHANYSIPLQVPPGRSKLEPHLSLNYDSGSGNGAEGIGWGFSTGFPSAITRGRSIFARDGFIQGVNFNINDKYYLDGKRLVDINNTSDGSSGAIFRTELDSFQRISASTLNGIGCFQCVDKNGTTYTFGGTQDSYQEGGGETANLAYSYALSQVTDILGNYINLKYTNFGAGEYGLAEIDYTGSNGAVGGGQISPNSKVVFTYEPRTDQPITYIADRAFNHRARLAVITAYSGSIETEAYSLNYSNASEDGPGFDSATWPSNQSGVPNGRSRLTSIAPFFANPDPQNPTMQASPVTNIAWQIHSEVLSDSAAATNSNSNIDVEYIDQNFVGQDNYQLTTSNHTNQFVKTGDFDGDGRPDTMTVNYGASVGLSVALGNGNPISLTSQQNTAISGYFNDSAAGGTSGSQLLQAEGAGIASRFTIADFTGDGRDDILIHGFDGKLHLLVSTGNGFTGPNDSNPPFVGGQGSINWDVTELGVRNTWIGDHYYVNPMPCDLNGDGKMDYVCLTYQRFIATGANSSNIGFTTIRSLMGVLSNGDGTFGTPFQIGGPSMSVPTATYGVTTSPQNIDIRDMDCGVFRGDFNGDGLQDFLILVPVWMNIAQATQTTQPTPFTTQYGGCRWVLYLNQGPGPDGTPQFAQYNGVIPNAVTVGTDSVNTWYCPVTAGGSNIWPAPIEDLTATSVITKSAITSFEGASGSIDTFIMDVNHDGMADLVWRVTNNTADNSVHSGSGWYAMLSTGNFSSGGGFVGPVPLTMLNGTLVSTDTPQGVSTSMNAITSTIINRSADYDGDGEPDYEIEPATNGAPYQASVYLATPQVGSASPFVDIVTSIQDGLNKTTGVHYKAAKDPSIYTKGVLVNYPIREFFSSEPAVSEVDEDMGSSIQTPLTANFAYQYSGNRLDLSGRGSLGFHSFVTLDEQTNLFKYQFLAQSFPMTGLVAREETYHYLSTANSGTAEFKIITAHDNTVVFDEVLDTATSSYSTLYPFISQAVESRWEDSSTPDFTFPNTGPSSAPELLFPQKQPPNSYLTVTAQSWFDNQPTASPVTTLPTQLGNDKYSPSDQLASNGNTVGSTLSYGDFNYLPRSITYGNLTKLTTTYDPSFTSTTTNGYFPPIGPLTGLLLQTSTTATNNGFTDSSPQHAYTYWNSTNLVETDTVTASDAHLNYAITNAYSNGDLTSTSISGDTNASDPQYLPSYAENSYGAYDSNLDLATTAADAYAHATTTVYNEIVGKPSSITDPNGAEITTQFDPLGRDAVVTDVLTGIVTNTSYAFDSSQSVGAPTGSANGISETSAFQITAKTTVRPQIIVYYDRLGRPIRTLKQGFAGQNISTDTVYDNLGRVVATSLPYPAGGTAYWTFTTYDTLGRVSRVTAPNGTVTSETYVGRAKQTTITAGSAAEVTVTLTDGKGDTVGVWNADNVPTSISQTTGGSTSASVSFILDGFGRMRGTSLLGLPGSQQVQEYYDALGNEAKFIDPDRGTWQFTNNALGEQTQMTDAKGDTTVRKFDELKRPISRVITETTPTGGVTETDGWSYYDTSANAATFPNLLPLGTMGWIGSLALETESSTGALGYGDPGSSTTHYYDPEGRPQIDINSIDGTWFYTFTGYDGLDRVAQVQSYWRPAGHEKSNDMPFTWSSFGYSYNYDLESYVLSIVDTTPTARTWWSASATSGYDYMDRPVIYQKGSAYWTQRTYNAVDGTLTGIATGTSPGSESIQNLSYVYDGFGNLSKRTDAIYGGTESLTYDLDNRLTQASNKSLTANYGYDGTGNITSRGDINGNSSAYTYGGTQPHAATSAWGYSMGYDGNGNIVSRSKTSGEAWNFRWTGFDMPRWMGKTVSSATNGSQFDYNADHSRILQAKFSALSSGVPANFTWKRVYGLGANMEVDYTNTASSGTPVWANTKARIYIPGPDGVVGTAEFAPAPNTNGISLTEKDEVYHYDHLGSIQAITPAFNTNGNLAKTTLGLSGLYSEDAWGQRRNPNTYSGLPTTTDTGGSVGLSPRGFTKHEMLDDLSLVHMNGRIYDPLLGRFLSADTVIQAPGNLQSYNRYSYVLNDPLKYTDPTGWFFMEMLPDWAQVTLNATTMGQASALDHGIDRSIASAQEVQGVYNLGRSSGDSVTTSSITAAAVGVTRFTGAMDWAEAVQGEKIVTSNGSASTQEITDPKEVAAKAVGGAAGMALIGVGGGELAESRLSSAAPKTGSDVGVVDSQKAPNPAGSKGAPDHVAGTNQEADRLTEKYADNPNAEVRSNQSLKDIDPTLSRRPDVAVVDAKQGKILEVSEVARTNADGTLVSRERAKLPEYEKRGIPVNTVKLPDKANWKPGDPPQTQ
jgi:RHS repeat-associated protein